MQQLIILVALTITLSGCSSLITRSELSSCQKTCQQEGSLMKSLKKDEGKLACECQKIQKVESAESCH